MYLEDEELKKYYDEISSYHKQYLDEYGVKLPHWKVGDKYSRRGLALIYLYINRENPVSKKDLTDFILQYPSRGESTDIQDGRHLAQQSGWYVISGTRGDKECPDYNVKSGEYSLISVEKHYPKFKYLKRQVNLSEDEWDSIKKDYDYRCATCGSKEGEKNYHTNNITKLEKGHMDPTKSLVPGNIIPQCQDCNRQYQDNFVYTTKGRVQKIANANFVRKSTNKVKEEMFELLKEELKK